MRIMKIISTISDLLTQRSKITLDTAHMSQSNSPKKFARKCAAPKYTPNHPYIIYTKHTP